MQRGDENISELISAVKEHSILYDKNHPHYESIELKKTTWEKVAKQCNISETTARKKWKNLRDYFKRILNDEERGTTNHDISHAKSSWLYKEQMEFLRDYLSFSKTGSYAASEASDEEGGINKSKKSRSVEVDSLLYEYLKRKRLEKHPKDSLTKFFEYAESSVRAMRADRQVTAKEKITEIILQLEQDELNEKNQAPKRQVSLQSPILPVKFSLQPQNPLTSAVGFHSQHPQIMFVSK